MSSLLLALWGSAHAQSPVELDRMDTEALIELTLENPLDPQVLQRNAAEQVLLERGLTPPTATEAWLLDQLDPQIRTEVLRRDEEADWTMDFAALIAEEKAKKDLAEDRYEPPVWVRLPPDIPTILGGMDTANLGAPVRALDGLPTGEGDDCVDEPADSQTPLCHPFAEVVAVAFQATYGAATYECSGIAVAPRLVLTARHCVTDHGAPVEVWVGEQVPPITLEESPLRFEVLDQFGFRQGTGEALPDVVAIEVDRDLTRVGELRLHPMLRPDPLDCDTYGWKCDSEGRGVYRSGDEVTAAVVGFGQSELYASATFGRRRHAVVRTLDWTCDSHESDCDPGEHLRIQSNPEQGGATCFGDSGGPLFEWHEGRWIVAGLTSGAIDSKVDCGKGSLFQRVDRLHAWVTQLVLDLEQQQEMP